MKTLFLTSNANTVINDVVTRFERFPKGMRLVFITTAAEGEAGDKKWLQQDRDALTSVGFEVTDYTLTGKSEEDVRLDLVGYEVIFFSGGNTFYLLEQIQKSNSTEFFREEIEKGVIYIGSSAGSVVAGPTIEIIKNLDAVENAPDLKGFTGLNLVDFVVLPHWGSQYFKEQYLNSRLEQAYSLENKVILLTDNQYIHVTDDWYQIVKVA